MVSRLVRVQEAVGSNPATRTKIRQNRLVLTDFSLFLFGFCLKNNPLIFPFLAVSLLTTAPPQTGKTALPSFVRKCGFYLSLCGMPLLCPSSLFGGDFRFGLGDQLRQALLTGLPIMGIDVAGPLHPVRPHRRVPPFPQVVTGLGDASGTFVWPESPARETFWLIYGSSSSSPAASSALNRRGEPM